MRKYYFIIYSYITNTYLDIKSFTYFDEHSTCFFVIDLTSVMLWSVSSFGPYFFSLMLLLFPIWEEATGRQTLSILSTLSNKWKPIFASFFSFSPILCLLNSTKKWKRYTIKFIKYFQFKISLFQTSRTRILLSHSNFERTMNECRWL